MIEMIEQKDSILVKNLEEMRHFWFDLLPKLSSEKVLILLDGEVGAGKTSSVQIICNFFQAESASSPSFAIHHSYKGVKGHEIQHVDLYRVESEEDLESTGFWDLFSRPSFVIVEWANFISEEAWPLGWQVVQISLKKMNQNTEEFREISYKIGKVVP